MVELASAHDKFISKALERSDTAKDIIGNHLPAHIRDHLDFNTLAMVKDSFIDEKLKKYFSDKLFKINFKKNGWAYLYVLFEHKSYPDIFSAYQVLKYKVRIWDQVIKENEAQKKTAKENRKKGLIDPSVPHLENLPLIIPMVFYHGAQIWNVPLDFKSLIDENRPPCTDHFIPDFEYLLCDLSKYSDEELIGTVHYQVTMLLLKYIFHDDINVRLPDILKILNKLKSKQTILEFLETILEYLVKGTSKFTEKNIEDALEHAIPELKGGGIMQTLAEKWFSEGEKKGEEKGREEGEKEGILMTAANMIKAGLDMSTIRQVTGLTEQTLQRLAMQ